MRHSTTATAAIALSFLVLLATNSYAFDFPKLPGGTANAGAASTENAGDVVKNTRNSIYSFVKAELGLGSAMGGAEQLAAQQKLLDGMKTGDAAASKEDLETLVSIHSSAKAEIDKKVAENAKLDAKNKTLASQSMVEYVKGLVSTKKLIASIQNVGKNPMALGANLGSVTYLAKETPGLVSSGASTTTTLFKYLGSNGVDLSQAKKEAADLGV